MIFYNTKIQLNKHCHHSENISSPKGRRCHLNWRIVEKAPNLQMTERTEKKRQKFVNISVSLLPPAGQLIWWQFNHKESQSVNTYWRIFITITISFKCKTFVMREAVSWRTVWHSRKCLGNLNIEIYTLIKPLPSHLNCYVCNVCMCRSDFTTPDYVVN